MGEERYNYEALAQHPRLVAFFVGWYCQHLLIEACHLGFVYYSDQRPRWEQCRREVYRLALLVRISRPQSQLSEHCIKLLQALDRDFSPEGFRNSLEAITGRPEEQDPRCDKGPARFHAPSVADRQGQLTGELGAVSDRIRKLFRVAAQQISQMNAASVAATLYRYAYTFADWHDPPTARSTVHELLTALADLQLLQDWPEAPYEMRYDTMLRQLRASIGPIRYEGVEGDIEPDVLALLQHIPRAVSKHFDLPTPPRWSQIQAMPDLTPATRPTEILGPPVKLQGQGRPVLVLGHKKAPLSDSGYELIDELVKAFPNGLSKDGIEAIATDARRMLKRLRDGDSDWRSAIIMPRVAHRGYRLAWPDVAREDAGEAT